MVYGQEAIIPTHIFLSSLQLSQLTQNPECPIMQRRIDTLLHLEEEYCTAQNKFHKHQKVVKSWFDRKFASNKEFKVGDLVMKWDKPSESKGKQSKF